MFWGLNLERNWRIQYEWRQHVVSAVISFLMHSTFEKMNIGGAIDQNGNHAGKSAQLCKLNPSTPCRRWVFELDELDLLGEVGWTDADVNWPQIGVFQWWMMKGNKSISQININDLQWYGCVLHLSYIFWIHRIQERVDSQYETKEWTLSFWMTPGVCSLLARLFRRYHRDYNSATGQSLRKKASQLVRDMACISNLPRYMILIHTWYTYNYM